MLLAAIAPAAFAEGLDLRGRVTLSIPGVALRDLGPVVVYLERLDGPPSPPPNASELRIVQQGARFSPGFLIVSRGQAVDMP
ncbi:MAG: hypothetical protein OEV20_09810, partial [Actinomycetota bacterium]|nr:hypothetical protein [Actinomycetota bacterium]